MIKSLAKSSLWVGLYFYASGIGMTIAMIWYMLVNMNTLLDNIENEEVMINWIASCMIPGLTIAAVICILGFVVTRLALRKPFEFKDINFKIATFCIAIGIAFNTGCTYLLNSLYSILPEAWVDSTMEATSDVTNGLTPFWLLLLGVGILVPIMEEIIFRHGIYRTISESNVIAAYIISSLAFGIAHGNIIQGVYTTVMGILAAFLMDRGENLWYAILLHISLNTTTVIMSLFTTSKDFVFITLGVVAAIVAILLYKMSSDVNMLFHPTEETEQPQDYEQ